MRLRRSFRVIAVSIFAFLCALAFVAFRGAGRWLIREDGLAAADEIVVLSGSMPARAEQAGKIFQMGYAREIWVSRPESPREVLESEGIRFQGEEDYNRAILLHQGVPEGDVHVFPQSIVDTRQEIEEISAQMRHDGKTSVIIVTSPPHTRRVRALWRTEAGAGLRLIVRAAPEDSFDADHWWRNTRDTFAVVREVMGLLNVWLGSVVQPHS
jgi:uncharacterized SAM-binding protein YcdF (DUF218 family)